MSAGRWLIYHKPRQEDREEARTERVCTFCKGPCVGCWDDLSFSHEFGTETIFELVSDCCLAEMEELKHEEE